MASSSARTLEGLRIVVTRAPEQADALTRLLAERGAEVILLPAVAFEPPEDVAPLDAALQRLGSYDWLFFTSQNAVRFVVERGRQRGVRPGGERPRVGAVGPATAQAAREAGFVVAFMAETYRGAALAAGLGETLSGQHVLLPRSDRASRDLPDALNALGAVVDDVVAYRTLSPGPMDPGVAALVREGRADAIVFASPSAVQYVVAELSIGALQAIARRTVLVAIGPVTAGALREAGLPAGVTAAQAATGELVAALESWARTQGR